MLVKEDLVLPVDLAAWVKKVTVAEMDSQVTKVIEVTRVISEDGAQIVDLDLRVRF